MNIFALSPVPQVAAEWHCDKHIPKMIVESGQMLSTAHRILDGNMDRRPSSTGKTMAKYWELGDDRESVLYKAVHVGHPCTVWTMESHSNYKWHYDLFMCLCKEYTHRYGKLHLTEKVLAKVLKRLPRNIKKSHMTPFALAMGAEPDCIDHNDCIGSYQNFYQTKQKRFAMKWTKRNIPHWFKTL